MASFMGLIGNFIVLLFALQMSASEGTEYEVGDSLGWSFPPNQSYYSDWASTKTFLVGDKLMFNFNGTHTVGDVSKADFDSCNTKASAFGSNLNKVVAVRINLFHTGPSYFICTVGEHCLRGMKFSVDVENGDAAAPEAPLPGSPAPALSFGVLPLILSITVGYFLL